MSGFFGKLPASGDFVARGLGAGVRPLLDRWLTRQLARRDPEAWPPGGVRALIEGQDAALALMVLPSRDAAGRQFPLAACASADGADAADIDKWAERLLQPLTAAAAGELDADGLAVRIAAECPAATGTALSPPVAWTRGTSPERPEKAMPLLFGE